MSIFTSRVMLFLARLPGGFGDALEVRLGDMMNNKSENYTANAPKNTIKDLAGCKQTPEHDGNAAPSVKQTPRCGGRFVYSKQTSICSRYTAKIALNRTEANFSI